MSFAASVLPIVQAELATIFKTRATVNPEFNKQPKTAVTVFEKQNVQLTPMMNAAGTQCVGLEVWYRVADNTAIPTVAATPFDSECTITAGDGISTAKKTYDLNFFLDKADMKITINTKDCDNLAKFAPNVAFALASKMHLATIAINNYLLAQIEANKTVAVSTDVENVTVVGGEFTITGASYWSGVGAMDTLTILDQLAFEQGLPDDYYIIAGNLLQIPASIARDHAANDNERSYVITLNRRDITWDSQNFAGVIAADCIYLVSPTAFFGYLHSEYPEAGIDTKDANNTSMFSLPLTYYNSYQQGGTGLVPLMFMNNGTAQEARVDVRLQIVCDNATDKYGKPSYNHNFEIDVQGLIDVIPAEGDFTGIVRVNKAV